jgi:hypothetical protein
MVHALCARFKSVIAGGSAPAPWVTFLCTRKEKSPKESAPPGLHPQTPRVSSRRVRLRGCADATSLTRRRTLAIPRSPLRACASATRGARLDQGGLKNQLAPDESSVSGFDLHRHVEHVEVYVVMNEGDQ